MDIKFENMGFTQEEYERNRARLLLSLERETVEKFSWERFKKSDSERESLINAKAEWRATMRLAGLSKRCGRMNA